VLHYIGGAELLPPNAGNKVIRYGRERRFKPPLFYTPRGSIFFLMSFRHSQAFYRASSSVMTSYSPNARRVGLLLLG